MVESRGRLYNLKRAIAEEPSLARPELFFFFFQATSWSSRIKEILHRSKITHRSWGQTARFYSPVAEERERPIGQETS